jgi:tRNA/tmRNA/rRNA uracil-C5-methylase (TrmA/RlmC/RlmD family)
MTIPAVGERLEVRIERFGYGGFAIARHDGLAVFVPFGAPGDRAVVEVTEVEKTFVRAEIYALADLETHRSEKEIRAHGKLRVEGKEYVMQDGDICHFLLGK